MTMAAPETGRPFALLNSDFSGTPQGREQRL